jgi:hypothetical protein
MIADLTRVKFPGAKRKVIILDEFANFDGQNSTLMQVEFLAIGKLFAAHLAVRTVGFYSVI